MGKFYMIEFDLPEVLAPEFLALLPTQRLKVDELMLAGIIQSYSLSMNRAKLWIIMVADSEFEVLQLISELPLSNFMIPSITPLMFHHSVKATTAVSLN